MVVPPVEFFLLFITFIVDSFQDILCLHMEFIIIFPFCE